MDFGDTVTFMQNIKPAQNQICRGGDRKRILSLQCSGWAEFNNVIANLDTLTEQAYFAIITGEKPIDYFDTYVEEFKGCRRRSRGEGRSGGVCGEAGSSKNRQIRQVNFYKNEGGHRKK